MGLNFLQKINPAWFLAGAAFFLPIKPAPVNLFLVLAVIFALINNQSRSHILGLCERSELLPLWLLLAFLALTYFFSTNDSQTYLEFISKYGRLALIPILAAVLIDVDSRILLGKGFLAGVAVILALSYAIWLGVDPAYFGAKATDMYAIPSNPTVYKSHITHNFFLVAAIYLWVICFNKAQTIQGKALYALLLLL
ncbi:MAG TPA: hypothetical protein VFV28_08880, partial [Limnobacter sp.]|nr:hypothetical protein [Limnobacter sp.]